MRKIGYLVLSVLIGFCSCQHSTDRTAMHTVMVAHPENSGVKNGGKISLPGVIKEGQTVQVSFKTAGQITHLNVREGDYVKRGN